MSKAALPEEFEGLPAVTAAEMAEVDRLAIEERGVAALELMENAGAAVARETAAFLGETLSKEPGGTLVTVCCGRGNNGGDGLVAARRLKELGAEVIVFIAPPRREGGYSPEVSENLRRATLAGVSVQTMEPRAGSATEADTAALDVRLRSSDVIIDALLGTGSSGKPAGAVRAMIQRITRSGRPVVAVDIPSGLQPDTGHHSGVFVSAALTLTLGLPKRGLLAPHAARNVGRLKVLDIGFPKDLLAAAGGRRGR